MEQTKQIIALGFFDGVHLGHQALLRRCTEMAQALGAVPGAITFRRHPQALFASHVPPLINTVEDREALLRHYGMEKVHILPVTEEVMSTPWAVFLEKLLEKGAVGFVCGEDFRFGHRGEGNARLLQQFCEEKGLPCAVISDQMLRGQRISSTHIRQLLEAGDVEAAAQLLGHPHMLSGEVMSGRKLGRTIGIPTANLWIPEGVLVPKFGVYACVAHVEGKQIPAVTNIGTRPTVGGHRVTVEPWLLDFQGDLYGKALTLRFYSFLRPEEKFDSLDALKDQIRRDAQKTRILLGK